MALGPALGQQEGRLCVQVVHGVEPRGPRPRGSPDTWAGPCPHPEMTGHPSGPNLPPCQSALVGSWGQSEVTTGTLGWAGRELSL